MMSFSSLMSEPDAVHDLLKRAQRRQVIRDLGYLEEESIHELDRILRLLVALLKVPTAVAMLVTDTEQHVISYIGMPPSFDRTMLLSHSFCQTVGTNEQLLIINDARTQPLAIDNLAIDDINVVAYAGFPLRAATGEVIGTLCAIDTQPRQWTPDEIAALQDVSELVNNEIMLRTQLIERDRMNERLMFLEQLRSDMIRYAAHDLRNPLSIIMGYLSLLNLDRDQLSERYISYFNMMELSGKKMQHIIDDIQLTEDIEISAAQPPNETIDLTFLVQLVMFDYEDDALAKQIDLSATIAIIAAHVIGDLNQLQHAMSNLVSNAVKYTPPGGKICVRLDQEGKNFRFQIVDNGIGITDDDQASIWRPFYRVRSKDTIDIDGTGLGLFMVKRIIDRHNGSVYLQSEIGKGSVVGFTLPAHE